MPAEPGELRLHLLVDLVHPALELRDLELRLEVDPVVEVRRAPTARGEPVPTDLVDRDRETTALRRAIDDVAEGTPGWVVVEGPAGIGKTRLMREAVRLATAGGLQVVTARGSQLERSFGFGAVRQLFEPCLADPEHRQVLLDGAGAGADVVF